MALEILSTHPNAPHAVAALEALETLDNTIHQKARLGIMSTLLALGEADFKLLKETLALSDGNLSTHLALLEERGYVEARKEFIRRKPHRIARRRLRRPRIPERRPAKTEKSRRWACCPSGQALGVRKKARSQRQRSNAQRPLGEEIQDGATRYAAGSVGVPRAAGVCPRGGIGSAGDPGGTGSGPSRTAPDLQRAADLIGRSVCGRLSPGL